MTGSGKPRPNRQEEILSLVLRVGLFILIVTMGMMFLPVLLIPLVELYAASVLSVFIAGGVANAVAYRIWEGGTLFDAGFDWTAGARRNLVWGIGFGIASALLTMTILALTGQAKIVHIGPISWSSLLFVSIALMFGAVGEELMFRGYGFQMLAGKIGKYATLLPMAVVFGILHLSNLSATLVSLINTIGWGLLLGYAVLRTRGLWLAIGIHYGWNWTLPVLGAPLSGFKMSVVGLRAEEAQTVWGGGSYGPEGSLLLTLLLPGLFYLVHKAPLAKQDAMLLRSLDDET
jgi:uncharacterized protein